MAKFNGYIEIAREYQSVLVSNVPVFDAGNDDAPIHSLVGFAGRP